jgi:hypothetical protein
MVTVENCHNFVSINKMWAEWEFTECQW